MTSILLIILIIIFFVIIFLLSVGTYLLSALFGGFVNLKNFVRQLFGLKTNNQKTSRSSSNKTTSSTSSSSTSAQPTNKVFQQDEGTYVDFEEVK